MTTEQAEQTQLRPFHETIVEAIERVGDGFQLDLLMYLILGTKIPENHDSVIAAFKKAAEAHTATGSYPCGKWLMDSQDVEESLLAQKRAAEAAVSDVTCSFRHGGKERALMIVIEKIISIIQNWRQPSPQTRDKVAEIFKLFETAKRIYRASDEAEFKLAITEL